METCKICGKKYISQEWLDKHIDKYHPIHKENLAKGWQTPCGFIDFSVPVTYAEACKMMNEIREKNK